MEPELEEVAALSAAKLDGLRKKINAASWNDDLERLLKGWGEKAAGLRYMHNSASGYWRDWGNTLTMVSIIVSSVAGGVSLLATGLDDQDAKDAVMFAVGGVGLLSSIIQSFKKFYNSEEKAADHGVSSKQFGSFYRFMTIQLGMPREDRWPSDRLSEYVLREYERMQQDARPLGGDIISNFRKNFDNKKQAFPDICETSFIIHVYDPSVTPVNDPSSIELHSAQ